MDLRQCVALRQGCGGRQNREKVRAADLHSGGIIPILISLHVRHSMIFDFWAAENMLVVVGDSFMVVKVFVDFPRLQSLNVESASETTPFRVTTPKGVN